ncbi:hypothetical protein F511_34252 [Dorcoceras hygrometricum]|uniref:Uncharacterized protein n=1 Tax=Dorcoceras hygrometricum TaxID=472368 RepID=A0A2Z7D3G2_9LAMI|nr:hypothetical protein F511_34252 [Dorcoceras hygrometricum]
MTIESRYRFDCYAIHLGYSDIACATRTSGESSTTRHRLQHASGPYLILPPDDPHGVGERVKVRHLCRVSMMF